MHWKQAIQCLYPNLERATHEGFWTNFIWVSCHSVTGHIHYTYICFYLFLSFLMKKDSQIMFSGWLTSLLQAYLFEKACQKTFGKMFLSLFPCSTKNIYFNHQFSFLPLFDGLNVASDFHHPPRWFGTLPAIFPTPPTFHYQGTTIVVKTPNELSTQHRRRSVVTEAARGLQIMH